MIFPSEQNSTGDLSPNVSGKQNKVTIIKTENIWGSKPLGSYSREVEILMQLIEKVGALASENRQKPEGSAHEFSKNAQEKIFVRFKPYSQQLVAEYQALKERHLNSYDIAIKESEIDDVLADDIAWYLQDISAKALLSTNDDPIKALDVLYKQFVSCFDEREREGYSIRAIRYYLFEELIKCNVFPNPNELIQGSFNLG